jgi:DNA-binding NarL/FixJ family response regulator
MHSVIRSLEHYVSASTTDPRVEAPSDRTAGPHVSVLVVDDDPDTRECLEGLLSMWGYAVESVESAERALEHLMRERLPDVIMLDLLMPGMGGLGFLERVNQARLAVPVIVLSAISPTQTVVEAMRQGASEYLTKPFGTDELALAVARVLERPRLKNDWDSSPPIKPAAGSHDLEMSMPPTGSMSQPVRTHGATRSLRVLLADPQAIRREGLRMLLEKEGLDVVGEAADGIKAVRLARHLEPDVAVLDAALPLQGSVDAAREILHDRRTKVILLSSAESDPRILEAVRAGVTGCVLESHGAAELARAIRETAAGRTHFSPGASQVLAEAFRHGSDVPPDPLTARERQILQLIAEGKRAREIGELLCISVKTAQSHRARIVKKLGITDTAGLVRYAIRRGLSSM